MSFLKRHKGKLILGTALLSGLAAQRYYSGDSKTTQWWIPPKAPEFSTDHYKPLSPTLQMMSMDEAAGSPTPRILDEVTNSIRSGNAFAHIPGVRLRK